MQFNVTATWHHREAIGQDAEGRDVLGDVQTAWPCVFDPGSSSENTTLQDQVTTQPQAIGQPGNPLPSASDRMSFPDPIGTFEVDGTPDVYPTPFPFGRGKIGPVCKLRQVSG